MRSQAHECLRSSTRSLHSLVEREFMLSLVTGTRGYHRLLLLNWPFASIETALERAGIERILPDWTARRRRLALAADLHHLGIDPPDLSAIEIASDEGTLLGWSYVLEGSRLGARMILKSFESHPHVASSRFLAEAAEERHWHSYKIALSRIDDDPEAIDKACVGANAAFQRFLYKPHEALTSDA